jgi:hypothetical protein
LHEPRRLAYANRITRTETDTKGEEVEREIPFMKGYTVFNAEQCEDLPAHYTVQGRIPLPRTIEIDGRRYAWRELVALRRTQGHTADRAVDPLRTPGRSPTARATQCCRASRSTEPVHRAGAGKQIGPAPWPELAIPPPTMAALTGVVFALS